MSNIPLCVCSTTPLSIVNESSEGWLSNQKVTVSTGLTQIMLDPPHREFLCISLLSWPPSFAGYVQLVLRNNSSTPSVLLSFATDFFLFPLVSSKQSALSKTTSTSAFPPNGERSSFLLASLNYWLFRLKKITV